MIPTKDKNIIVGVKNKNSFKWYLTPKALWIFDISKLNPGERIKYAKDIVEYRSSLDIISKSNYTQFIAGIHELKIDTFQLKTDMLDMTMYDPTFIEDYLPALYVDFDSMTYYAHNENMEYYNKGISKDFTFKDEDFLDYIPTEYRYWQ